MSADVLYENRRYRRVTVWMAGVFFLLVLVAYYYHFTFMMQPTDGEESIAFLLPNRSTSDDTISRGSITENPLSRENLLQRIRQLARKTCFQSIRSVYRTEGIHAVGIRWIWMPIRRRIPLAETTFSGQEPVKTTALRFVPMFPATTRTTVQWDNMETQRIAFGIAWQPDKRTPCR